MENPGINLWTVAKPTTHMRKLCKELGPDYRIATIDLERVIYRNFGNGYDIEISRVNTTSLQKKACIYLWKDQTRIIKIIENVTQSDIGARVERMNALALDLTDADFGEDGFLREPRTEYA